MSKKTSYFPYIVLIGFVFAIINLPKPLTDKIRREAVASVAPLWGSIGDFKEGLSTKIEGTVDRQVEQSHLSLENELLTSQIEGVYEWLTFEQRIEEQMERLKSLTKEPFDTLYWSEFFRRRGEELKQILETELQSLPAKVIFREPSSWSSSLWINIGEKENEAIGRTIVAKNSPVVIGDSLIGVVEYVGKSESRVRLITDSGLVPSVRAVRGKSQNQELLQLSKALLDRVATREELFSSVEEKKQLLSSLLYLLDKVKETKEEWYLAKGELYGSSHPLWRSKDPVLKGIGFQYARADKEGPSRDLVTGAPLDSHQTKELQNKMALIKSGDLLVTTGMDGVFPAGLNVAIVSKVFDLKEGDSSYEIEAKPTARNLEDLKVVFVMPPLEFQKKESF